MVPHHETFGFIVLHTRLWGRSCRSPLISAAVLRLPCEAFTVSVPGFGELEDPWRCVHGFLLHTCTCRLLLSVFFSLALVFRDSLVNLLPNFIHFLFCSVFIVVFGDQKTKFLPISYVPSSSELYWSILFFSISYIFVFNNSFIHI